MAEKQFTTIEKLTSLNILNRFQWGEQNVVPIYEQVMK